MTGATAAADRARGDWSLTRLDAALLAGIGTLGAILVLWRLGASSLYDWDEATYAEIAREVYVFHDWVHLHWDYAPWLNKAPLYVWLTAAAYQFGVGEFTARLVSALSAVVLFATTYLLGRRCHGRLGGLVATLVLATAFQFVLQARFGTSDELLTMFLYLTLLAFLLALEADPRWAYAAGVAFGLALLTKGFAALVLVPALAAALAVEGRLGWLQRREPWLALGLAALVALPWHLAMLGWQGTHFVGQYFDYMVVQRATEPVEGHVGGPDYYLGELRRQFYPWAYALPLALLVSVWSVRTRRFPSILLILPALILLLYTAASSKLWWYIVPMYPALAVVVGGLFAGGDRWRRAVGLAGAAAACGLALWVPRAALATPLWVFGLAGAAAALVVGVGLGFRRLPLRPLLVIAFALLLSVAAVAESALYAPVPRPAPALASALAGPGRPTGPVVMLIVNRADDISHSLLFYSHRRMEYAFGLPSLGLPPACGGRDVVLAARFLRDLRGAGSVRVLRVSQGFAVVVVAAPCEP